MRTARTLAKEAQDILDDTLVNDTFALITALEYRDTMRQFADRILYVPEVQ